MVMKMKMKWKRKRALSLSIMILFIGSLSFAISVTARPPPVEVHFYKYWDDAASYDHSTSSAWGGSAKANHGDLDNLEIYASTGGWFDTATAKTFIDGGRNDNSPWSFSTSEYYSLRVYWEISGTFSKDHSNVFKFEYTLYHMSGSSKIVDMTKTYSYSSGFDYDNKQVSHYVSSANLNSGTDYYLECTITLQHSTFSVATSDM
jgi:hypothetical protein